MNNNMMTNLEDGTNVEAEQRVQFVGVGDGTEAKAFGFGNQKTNQESRNPGKENLIFTQLSTINYELLQGA